MALTLLTGKTGSGKSYHAVSLIVEAVMTGRKVFTNIKINIKDDNYVYLDELAVRSFLFFIETTFKDVSNLEEKKDELKDTVFYDADFFIDEAHLVGFRDKKESILNWLTLQRHFLQNIHIITQVPSNIHRDYLMMFHSHVDMIPPNKRLSKNSMGYREFDAYKGDRINTTYFKPKLELFEMYNSGAVETGVSQDVKKIAFVAGALLIGLFALWFVISSLFEGSDNPLDMPVNYGNLSKFVPVPKEKTVVYFNPDDNDTISVMVSSKNGTYFDAYKYDLKTFTLFVKSQFKDLHRKVISRNVDTKEVVYKYTFK